MKQALKELLIGIGFLAAGLIALFLMVGCANISTSRVDKDGTTHKFRALTFFGNSSLQKLDVDHKTDKTYGGLKIGSLENETAAEAIKAITEAAVAGAIKGAKGAP